MAQRQKAGKKHVKGLRPRRPPESSAQAGGVAAGEQGVRRRSWSAWFRDKRPILQFLGLFALFMGVFYAVTATTFCEQRLWVPYLDLNAEVSGAVLNFLGQDVIVSGRAVSSPQASLLIERGCDAIHPSALFLSAVVAFPVALRAKLLGAVVGVVLLAIANLIRIISLYYIKIHFPRAFEIMHVEVWQALFIFLAVLLWLVWAAWAERRRSAKVHVSA